MNRSGEVIREREIGDIIKHLERRDWCAVIAPALSGKSTLARQLRVKLADEHPSWKIAHVEFKHITTLREAWHVVKEGLEGVIEPHEDAGDPFDLTETVADLVGRLRKHLCLLLDRLDGIPDEVLRSFLSECRRLRNEVRFKEASVRLHLVVFGGMEVYYLAAGDLSPFTNVFHIVDFPDLSEELTAQLFTLRTGKEPSCDEASKALFRETSGHPYLISKLAAEIGEGDAFTADRIQWYANDWSTRCVLPSNPVDESLAAIAKYLESNRRAFDVVCRMIEGSDPPEPKGAADGALLCGALCERERKFHFRGRMIERALKLYLDRIRKADYLCLHGEWDEALASYETSRPRYIRERRALGVGVSYRHLSDLYQALVSYSLRFDQLSQAEEFVTVSAKHLFGAERAILWRVPDGKESVEIAVGLRPPAADASAVKTVFAAIRTNATLKLEGNKGIVQGVGADPKGTRWALDLEYDEGLPDWVETELVSTERLLHTILRRVEEAEKREHKIQATIHKVLLELLRATSVSDAFKCVARGLHDMDYECAMMSLLYPAEQQIRAVESSGAFKVIEGTTKRELSGNDVLARVIRSKSPIIVPDCLDPAYCCDTVAIELAGLRSQIVFPLIVDDRAIGTLQVGNTNRENAFSARDQSLLEPFADATAIAVQMATERASLELALFAVGDAMAVVDSNGLIVSRNEAYNEIFHVQPGDAARLTNVSETRRTPIVQAAFESGRPLQTMREIEGKRYIVTAAGQRDHFGRYAGGVEIIDTRNPLNGLTTAVSQMLAKNDVSELMRTIVEAIHKQFGYPRVRLYRSDAEGTMMRSAVCIGMPPHVTTRFHNGGYRFRRKNVTKGDGFECFPFGPLIIVRRQFAEPDLPYGEVALDTRYRRVLVLDDKDLLYIDELAKAEIEEWMEVPLGDTANPIGKVTIDLLGTRRQFELEDIEVMSLFGRLAADAISRAVTLNQAQRAATVASDARHLGGQAGFEAISWRFLLHITMHGGPELNRAAIFVRRPRAEGVTGFLCHGAADSKEFSAALAIKPAPMDREKFIDDVAKLKSSGELPKEDSDRIVRFRSLTIVGNEPDNPFAQALTSRQAEPIRSAAEKLAWFYNLLAWEPPYDDKGLICPLVFGGECEGLLYADRAFSDGGLGQISDYNVLEAQSAHFAASAYSFRLAAELRHQVQGLAHVSIAPMGSIKGLAQGMWSLVTDDVARNYLSLIAAESQRASDSISRMLAVAKVSDGEWSAYPQLTDVCALLRERILPYCTLLEAEGINTTVECEPAEARIRIDPFLMGAAFAEMASNAREVLKNSQGCADFFRVAARFDLEQPNYVIVFENSGPVIPEKVQPRIFEPFISGLGGSGIGLSLVDQIARLHGGSVHYVVTPSRTSRFILVIPARKELLE